MDGTNSMRVMASTAMTVAMQYVPIGTVAGAERTRTAPTNVVCGTAGVGLNLARIIGAPKSRRPWANWYTDSGSACKVGQPSVFGPRQNQTAVAAVIKLGNFWQRFNAVSPAEQASNAQLGRVVEAGPRPGRQQLSHARGTHRLVGNQIVTANRSTN